MSDERPPRLGLGLVLKAILGGVAVMALTSAAVATGALLKVKELKTGIDLTPAAVIKSATLKAPKPGEAQTLLLVGTDQRYGQARSKVNADTMMLIRLDPRREATAVLNVPRDLAVEIPRHGMAKINRAYAFGGLDLTAQTVKKLLRFDISHAIAIDFKGFRRAVDKLGCVYVDVDRRYFNDNAGPQPDYAVIDLQPGYQSLCGQHALDYVRYRHGDSDLVRAARQQGFLRAAKDQIGTSKLLSSSSDLVKIFGRAAQTDPGLHQTKQIVRLIEQAVLSAGNPVRQLKFPADEQLDTAPGGLGDYLTVTPAKLETVRATFLAATKSQQKPKQPAVVRRGAQRARQGSRTTLQDFGLVDATQQGRRLTQGLAVKEDLGFPVYFPAGITQRSQPPAAGPMPRAYTLRDRAGKAHRAYRIVMAESVERGEYWGVQGTTWRTPPVLTKGGSPVRLRGRDYRVFYDAKRIRVVSWRTPRAVYWVSNTLGNALTNTEMLGIARSLTRSSG
ncbi:MAG: LCP family protein [Solirubrobacterales bacterium]|nr:LCP family protein [Solirubrobacterales bacterium]